MGMRRRRPTVAAGGGYDTDAQAFFTATGITDNTIKDAIDDLVVALKAASIWSECLAIYPFVGGDATKHSYNLKNPATHQLSYAGTGSSHGANGWNTGSAGYANPGINPSSHLTLNDTHLSIYSRSTGDTSVRCEWGCNNGASTETVEMGTRQSAAGYFISYLYAQSGGRTRVAIGDGSGFFLVSKRAVDDCEHYRNGSSVITNTASTLGALPNMDLYLGCTNGNGAPTSFSQKELAFASIGTSLDDTQASDFYTAVETFQDALSRGVV